MKHNVNGELSKGNYILGNNVSHSTLGHLLVFLVYSVKLYP